MPSYTLSPGSSSPAMRIFYLLVSLDLILTASVPYANRPKSCWLELTKKKGDQCFPAEPECSQSCRPGEPVSGILCLFFARVKKWNALFFCPRKSGILCLFFWPRKKVEYFVNQSLLSNGPLLRSATQQSVRTR